MDLELSRVATVADNGSQVAGFVTAVATSDADHPASSLRTPHPTQEYSGFVADALTRLVEQQMRAQYDEHRMKMEALQARMESELLEKQEALLRALRSGSSFAVPEAGIDPCGRVPCSCRDLDDLRPSVVPQPAKRAASGRCPRSSEKDPEPSLVHVIRPRTTTSPPIASDTNDECTDACRTAGKQGSDEAADTCDPDRTASPIVGLSDAAVTWDPDRTASPRVENVFRQDARDLPEAGGHSSNGSDSHDSALGGALSGLTNKPLHPNGASLDRCCAVYQLENPPDSGHSEDTITPTSSASSVQPLLVPGCSTFALSELDSDRLCGVGRDNLDSCGEDELASQSIHVPVPTSMVSVAPAAIDSVGLPDGERSLSLSSMPTDWSRLLMHSDSDVAALPPVSDSKIVATSVSTGAIPHLLVDKIARPAGAAVGSSGTCLQWVASPAADLSALPGPACPQAAEQELLVAVRDLDTGKQSAPPIKHTVAVVEGNSNVKDWLTLDSSTAARDRCMTSTLATVSEPPAAHHDLLPVPASVQLCGLSALRTPDEDDDLSTSLRLSLRQKHARQLANLRCYYEEELDSLRRHMSSHEFMVTQEPYRKLLSDNEHLQKRVRLLDEELTRAYKYITSVDKQMAALESTVKAFTSESKQAFSEDSKDSAKRTLKASEEALQASRKDQELLRTSLRKLRAENQFLREEASRLRRELKQTTRTPPAVISESIETGETSLCLGAPNQLYDVSGTDMPTRATALLAEPHHRHIVGAATARGAIFSGASASQVKWPRQTEQASGSLPSCGSSSTSVSYSTPSSHTSVESPQPSVRPATDEHVGSFCGARPPRTAEASPCDRKRGDAAGRALIPSRSSSVRLFGNSGTVTMLGDCGIRGTAVGGSADDEEEEDDDGGIDGDDDSESEVGGSQSSLPIAAAAAEQPSTATTVAGTSINRLRRHGPIVTTATTARAAVVAPSTGCAVVTPVRAATDSAAAARSCPVTPAAAAAACTSLESQRLSASGAVSSSKRRSSDIVLPAGDVAATEPLQQQQSRQQLLQLQTRHLSCPFQQAAFSSPLQSGSLLHAYSPVATSSPDHKRRSSGSDSDARLGSRARSGRSQLSALGDTRTSGGESSAIRAASCSSTIDCPSSSAASEVQLSTQKQQPPEQQLQLLPPSHTCSDPVSLSSTTVSAVVRSAESVGSSPNSAKNGDASAVLPARSMSAATSAHFEKRSPSEKKAKATQTHPSAADVLKQQQQHHQQQQQRGSPARRSLHTSFASSGSVAQLSAVNHHSDQQVNSWNGTTTRHNNHSTAARSGAVGEVHRTVRPAAAITTTSAACTLERVQLMHDLETRLDELLSEKRELEAVLSRMPISGGTLQDRLRKEEVEQQLDSVDRNLGSVRIALRRYKAL